MSRYVERQETCYHNENTKNTKLTDLSLGHDSFYGYYLSAKYRVEDEHSVRELEIPVIRLDISPNYVAIRQEGLVCPEYEADIGFGYLSLARMPEMPYYTERILEEKTHEMTLDEIEKKLGYKVKIVNK